MGEIQYLFLFILILNIRYSTGTCITPAIDPVIFEEILDAEECHRQIRFIRSNTLLGIQFADAGIRTPRGILTGNTVDLGNYFQCLGINHHQEDMEIQGKYCSMLVPFNQTIELPLPQDAYGLSMFTPNVLNLDDEAIGRIEEIQFNKRMMLAAIEQFDATDNSRAIPEVLASRVLRLGVCVPKPCSTQQAISSLLFNTTAIGFQYTEDFCRIPNDKPWSTADTMFVVTFSIIGVLTLMSTLYDICVRFILKKDAKEINPLKQSFSLYTNGQRLMNVGTGSGTMQCLDGIRTLAMMWVIVGHSFVTEVFDANPADSGMWMISARALWVTSADLSVDTFFTLAGILLVYTSIGKMTSSTFLKNLHWFYLNRVVRIYPLMAMTILLQASYLNRIFDGPYWWNVAVRTERCRRNWWSTILNLQNYLHPGQMCAGHTWYISIDMQLYFMSPLVLYWVLKGKKNVAWIALFTGLFGILIASSIFNFIYNFPGGNIVPSRPNDNDYYMNLYYNNALPRASPFFVGMVYGYLLNICRGSKVQLPRYAVTLLWVFTAATFGTIFHCNYRIKQMDWDNQLVDNLMNSFMRPMWAAAVCWIIFACVHGYSGPINWFLSLDIWRVPARLTYGMYLFHYPLMFSINATEIGPVYFSVTRFIFKYLSHQVLAIVVSFILTLLVDSPIYFLFKMLMDTVQKKRKPAIPASRDDGIQKEEEPTSSKSIEIKIDEHKTQ